MTHPSFLQRLRGLDGSDWSLTTYYLFIALTGALGFLGDVSPRVEDALGIVFLFFSVSMVIFGVSGMVARVWSAREAEVIVLICISAASVMQGVLLFLFAGPAGSQAALRLVVVPLAMLPYAMLRRRTVVTSAEVRFATEQEGTS